MQHQEHKSHYF